MNFIDHLFSRYPDAIKSETNFFAQYLSEEFVLIRPWDDKVLQFNWKSLIYLMLIFFLSLKALPLLNSVDGETSDVLSHLIQPYIEIMFIIVNVLDMVSALLNNGDW